MDIYSEGSIVDRHNNGAPNIEARNLDLVANTGTIGTNANPFDINSSYFLKGYVNAEAEHTVHLIETAGTMHVGIITSRTDDVTLITTSGSILDFHDDNLNNISGVNINLIANLGDIGEKYDALEIDSSSPAQGWLNATAIGSDIDIAETSGAL